MTDTARTDRSVGAWLTAKAQVSALALRAEVDAILRPLETTR